jgi:tetratricopeptide (TPR) repeat protein/transcriptional regulator with XRE-family HTH domain
MGGEPASGFGDRLRQFRKKALLTQEELAARARLGVRTIQDLERGVNQTPRPATVRQLADGLGLVGPAREQFLRPARGQDQLDQTAGSEIRYSLPPDTAVFTGREPELGRITARAGGAAGAGGVLTIQAIDGMPGVGKTALAVHAAHLLADQFTDRQVFIDLHAHTPGQEPVRPEDALAWLLVAAGIDPRLLPGDLEGRAGLWRDRMAGQRALIVLDNAADSSQVVPLLPGDRGCLVLVTSRRHLGDLPGEAAPVLLDALPPAQAAEMFIRLAPSAAGSPAEVAEVVRLAGFLPLAISLLARVLARHPSWVLGDLIAEIRADLLALTAEKSSIGTAFELSYQHLGPVLQRSFRLLGLHPGTTTDQYATAALTAATPDEATRLLDALHGEGLLTETGYRRFGMHDLLRRYARDLAAAGLGADSQRALQRLLDYYQHTGTRAEARLARQTRPGPALSAPSTTLATALIPALKDHEQALGWVRAERANLLGCLEHVTKTGEDARVIALTAALATLLRRDGPWEEAITRHAAAVGAAHRLRDRLGEANARIDLGAVRSLAGDGAVAAQDYERALVIYRDLGNRLGEANALHGLGAVRWQTGEGPAAAADDLEQALGIYGDLGDRLGEANALVELGIVQWRAGDYPAATQSLERALAGCRDLGNRLGEANALNGLGTVQRLSGHYQAAAGTLEQALNICRDVGSRLGEANALCGLGTVRRITGDYPAAIPALDLALGIYRDLGEQIGEANVQNNIGIVRRLTGDYLGAAGALEQALRVYRAIGERGGEAEVFNELGTLHRINAELPQARKCHQQSLKLARAVASLWDEAHALAGLGRCAVASGRPEEAADLLRQAQEIFRDLGAAEARSVLTELDALSNLGPPG